MFAVAVALVLGGARPELQHGGHKYWQGQGWTVYSYPDEGQCDLTAELVNGELLTVGYNAKHDVSGLIITNRHATSLSDNEKVTLQVLLLSKKAITSRYSVEFTTTVDESVRTLTSESMSPQFVKEFGRADMFGVFYGKHPVSGSASLPGSGVAVEQLITCARKAAGVDPLDPFRD